MQYNLKKLDRSAVALAVFFLIALAGPVTVHAAVTPSLGVAATYGVLGSTYTNTSVTTINGDVGFTTGPAVAPLGAHTNYGSGAPAGTSQGNALSALASQACTFTFAGGAINLSTDTTHGTAGVYAPGVYCSSGSMDVGGPLTVSGGGTYIFRSVGALTTTAGATVTLSGAAACDIFWTPSAATTLAANTTFIGTVISDAGITVGANTTWTGRALAFGGTVTTDTNTITAPTCTPTLASLHVIKQVVNTSGGTATSSDFMLHVKLAGSDVLGSPTAGTSTPGTLYELSAGTYVVSENATTSYTQSFSGDCDTVGSVTLVAGDNKSCTITNTNTAVASVSSVSTSGGHSRNVSGHSVSLIAHNVPMVTPSQVGQVLGTSTSTVPVSRFPNAGFPPENKSTSLNTFMIMWMGTLIVFLVSLYSVIRKYRS